MTNTKEFCDIALDSLTDTTHPREFGRILALAQAKAKARGAIFGTLVNRGYRGDFKTVEELRSLLERMGKTVRPKPLPQRDEELAKPVEIEGSFDPYNPASGVPGSVVVDPTTDDHTEPSPLMTDALLSREEKKRRRMEAEE